MSYVIRYCDFLGAVRAPEVLVELSTDYFDELFRRIVIDGLLSTNYCRRIIVDELLSTIYSSNIFVELSSIYSRIYRRIDDISSYIYVVYPSYIFVDIFVYPYYPYYRRMYIQSASKSAKAWICVLCC